MRDKQSIHSFLYSLVNPTVTESLIHPFCLPRSIHSLRSLPAEHPDRGGTSMRSLQKCDEERTHTTGLKDQVNPNNKKRKKTERQTERETDKGKGGREERKVRWRKKRMHTTGLKDRANHTNEKREEKDQNRRETETVIENYNMMRREERRKRGSAMKNGCIQPDQPKKEENDQNRGETETDRKRTDTEKDTNKQREDKKKRRNSVGSSLQKQKRRRRRTNQNKAEWG